MNTHVVLIRHARSTANSQGILAGRAEGVELDEKGRAQANALLERLDGVELAEVIGSPMQRCRQTVAPLLAGRDLHYRTDDRLTECDYGLWTGRSLAECALDPLWEQIQRTPSTVTFPEGESMQAMSERCVAAVADLVARTPAGSTVAVVSHGDPIKAIVAQAIGLDLDRFQGVVIDPASITLLRFTPERAFLVRLNDSAEQLSALLTPSTDAAVGGGAGSGGAAAAPAEPPPSL